MVDDRTFLSRIYQVVFHEAILKKTHTKTKKTHQEK